MRRIAHVGDERLRPGVAVEAGADERAVLVPRVARVGRRVDRADRETPRVHVLEDRGALIGAPRRLADREERERARFVEIVEVERAHVVDATGCEPVHLGDLGDADRGLVEHTVHAGRPVAIRRDLGDEQQGVGHERGNVLPAVACAPMNIGFIGLGAMGLPMTRHLVRRRSRRHRRVAQPPADRRRGRGRRARRRRDRRRSSPRAK